MTAASTTSDTEAIKKAIDTRIRGIREKNVESVIASYSRDVLTFDILEPLASRGVEAVRKRLTEWFGSFATAIDYDIRSINLAVADDVAFDTHFVHVHGTSTSGIAVDMWFRETVGWKKVDGSWRVVHQHSSVPFDMKTMKAQLDLEPLAD